MLYDERLDRSFVAKRHVEEVMSVSNDEDNAVLYQLPSFHFT